MNADIKDYLECRFGLLKEDIIKYLLKPIRKENKYRYWYIFSSAGIVVFSFLFYMYLNIIYFIFDLILLIIFFEVNFIQSGRLKNYKRRKELGEYYKYSRKKKMEIKEC